MAGVRFPANQGFPLGRHLMTGTGNYPVSYLIDIKQA
jgi:hypothetical protein